MDQFSEVVKSTMNKYLVRFPEEKDRLKRLQDAADHPEINLASRSTIPVGHIAATGIVLSPDYAKVLLIFHPYLTRWLFPGGHYEKDDADFVNAALRECKEETGIDALALHPWHASNGIPLDIDIHPIPENPKKNEGAHWHFDFRYAFTANPGDTKVFNAKDLLGPKWIDFDEVDPRSDLAVSLSKVAHYLMP